MGPSAFDSRPNCEPTRLARESVSDESLVGSPADSPLYIRVQKPGGIGELEPMMLAMRWAGRAVRSTPRPGGMAR